MERSNPKSFSIVNRMSSFSRECLAIHTTCATASDALDVASPAETTDATCLARVIASGNEPALSPTGTAIIATALSSALNGLG